MSSKQILIFIIVLIILIVIGVGLYYFIVYSSQKVVVPTQTVTENTVKKVAPVGLDRTKEHEMDVQQAMAQIQKELPQIKKDFPDLVTGVMSFPGGKATITSDDGKKYLLDPPQPQSFYEFSGAKDGQRVSIQGKLLSGGRLQWRLINSI